MGGRRAADQEPPGGPVGAGRQALLDRRLPGVADQDDLGRRGEPARRRRATPRRRPTAPAIRADRRGLEPAEIERRDDRPEDVRQGERRRQADDRDDEDDDPAADEEPGQGEDPPARPTERGEEGGQGPPRVVTADQARRPRDRRPSRRRLTEPHAATARATRRRSGSRAGRAPAFTSSISAPYGRSRRCGAPAWASSKCWFA